jgi:hypothetical protein
MIHFFSFLFFVLFSTVFGVEYELLAHQLVPNYFADLASLDAGVVGAPGEDLYSRIGGISDPTAYTDTDGKYRFQLIFKRLDNGEDQVLEWRQTSWIEEPSITGFEVISVPGSGVGEGVAFTGLGLSSHGNCFIDGEGAAHAYWWNCVGSIAAHGGGIPGYDQKVAKEMTLYIYVQHSCSALDIDGYLTLCSAEFTRLNSDISNTNADVTDNANDIGSLQSDTSNTNNDVTTNANGIASIESEITRIDAVLDQLEFVSAQVVPNNNYLSSPDAYNIKFEHYVIFSSILLNIILLSCACVIHKRLNQIDNRYKYGKVRSYVESDSEQPLQK